MFEPFVFNKQDADFRQWVKEHPEGLVLNVPNLMLHRPDCPHIGDLMTKAPKACADGPQAASALRQWAWDKKRGRLLICETCEA